MYYEERKGKGIKLGTLTDRFCLWIVYLKCIFCSPTAHSFLGTKFPFVFPHCPTRSVNQHCLPLCLIFNWAHLQWHTCHFGLVSLAQKPSMKGSAVVSLTLSKEQDDNNVFSYPNFSNLHEGGISTIETVQKTWTAHDPAPKQLWQFWGKKKVVKAFRDIIITALSHVTSLPERSEAMHREDPDQEGLVQHLQSSCSDNPRMLWLKQMVLSLASICFRRSSKSNCPLK